MKYAMVVFTLQIRTGVDSEVMQRAVQKRFVSQGHEQNVITIVTAARTLDIEVPSNEDREVLLTGLKVLLEHRHSANHPNETL